MPTKKISELTELASGDIAPSVDILPIVDIDADETKKVTVTSLHSGSFSGSFTGDGSSLTNLPASSTFPFTGDAVITGSLTVSGSGLTVDGTINGANLKTDATDIILGEGAGAAWDTSMETWNVVIGALAGAAIDGDCKHNVAIGYKAYQNATQGDYNVAIGFEALQQGTSGLLGSNVGIGYMAIKGSVGGQGNIGIGDRALYGLSAAGDWNIGIGYQAGYGYLHNQYDLIIGYQAGYASRDDYSIRIGHKAGYGAHGNAKWNVYIGNEAAFKSDNATGSIAIGHHAGYDLTDGDYNILIGALSAENITTGNDNITIGRSAGDTLTTGKNNIIIGPEVDVSVNSDSDQLKIGSGSVVSISGSLATGNVIFPQTASAAYFSGDGSNLTNLQRPITSSAIITGLTASSDNSGYYFTTGGNITCSIQANATVAVPTGAEYEFFQTSSAGNFLFETGSGVTFYSKGGALTLTGQYSAASLKKIDTDIWTLVGDLA